MYRGFESPSLRNDIKRLFDNRTLPLPAKEEVLPALLFFAFIEKKKLKKKCEEEKTENSSIVYVYKGA